MLSECFIEYCSTQHKMKFNSITGGSTSGTMWDGMGNKMSEATDVVIETRPADGVALLELNRPDALNAVNMDVRQKLAASADSLVEDPDIRVIVIAGRGGNFAAGSDVKVFAQTGAGSLLAQRMHRYWESLAHCPKPVIAAVEGYALGGGCELAMHADIIVAARTASFGQPEIKLGLMPGAGGTQRLLRAIGKYKTMLLALTGEMLPATEAEKYGLVSRLSEEGEALEEALKLARKIALMPALAAEQIKEAVMYGEDAPLETALRLERKAFQLLFDTEDKREGIDAFLTKRKPAFKGR
ncbi:3-hydroxybutyryl-CoA dehydratase [Brucella melitensis bv. 1 str. 16M]|uniref:Enoyl-CoA hydratase n=8 Tax=Brucella TaxID=234 RepID=C0GB74_9HYPH|nr:3-hydroxybutyryl-CoA dehydratase [Brucella melitensis bv. 1 str. 16M]EEH13092.1 enoyl-CoA hydratase [Brucella ceti str. Cudo]EEX78597.1 enoyl-CoA hydratase [Brucella abortus bv. 9 str. C68]EEX86127.1 enoyl-CoA hydratase [Brucella ceti B1/94]EEZ06212.1 enoyl-CoA hydratase [Brucella ceti M490/95/1]EEZ13742.1 enoyl-CoA hydratase [Brucella melitensis bv. 1 str. Rev.1]